MRVPLGRICILAATLALAACAASAPIAPNEMRAPAIAPLAMHPTGPDLGPFVVSMNGLTGRLEIWPLKKGGGRHPKPFSRPLGIGAAVALATKGKLVAIVTQQPAQLALYNAENQSLRTVSDPFGAPTDVAIGKDATIYVNNVPTTGSSVSVYAPPYHQAVELKCDALQFGTAVAVDNENDIFIQGYGTRASVEVAEIASGSQNCTPLPLKGAGGYGAGIVVDPQTDDLVTLDDPDYCAGGIEGRMTVYPKPYDKTTGRSRVLGFECSGGLRLSADSKFVLIGDTNLSISQILQRTFPDGGAAGIYRGGDWEGFTTIPGG